MFYFLTFIVFFFLSFFNHAWAEQKSKEADLEETSLGEIVVTATRTEKEVESAPASVSVVSKERIELKAPKTIDQALNDTSGLYIERLRGIMETRLSPITIRGISGQPRVLMLRDGVVLNDPTTGHARFGGFYPEDLERVEVVKGPFSSLYGGHAMGGVINFITKMPEKREFVFKSGYGSSWQRNEAWDDLRRFYISYGDKLWDKLNLFLSYGFQSTNGFPMELNVSRFPPQANIFGYENTKTLKGERAFLIGDRGDNLWWDDGITFKLQYDFTKDTKIGFSIVRNRYEQNNNEPHTYLRDQSGNAVWSYGVSPPPRRVDENTFLSGGGGRIQNIYALDFESNLWKDLRMKLKLSYFHTERDWYVTTLSGATRFGCGSDPKQCATVTNTPADSYMIDIQFSLPIFTNQILTFGGSFRQDKGNTKEEYLRDWRDEKSTTTLSQEFRGKGRTYSFFIQDEIMIIHNLTAYLGFRQDWWKTYDGYIDKVGQSGYPRSYPTRSVSSFSPKFALVYKPFKDTTLRGSIGKAFRPPTIYELYRDFIPPDKILRMGNPDLEPEKVISWDLGIEQKLWKGSKISLTYFENYLKDLIYYRDLGQQRKQLVNVGKAESRGIEFEFEQKFEKWLRLFANITYTDSEIKENEASPRTVGCRLTYIPLWTVNSGVEIDKSGFSATLLGRYAAKRYLNDDNSDKINNVFNSLDPYFVVDGRIAYQITKFAKLGFSVENIFDRKYYTWHKAAGRSWFADITLKF